MEIRPNPAVRLMNGLTISTLRSLLDDMNADGIGDHAPLRIAELANARGCYVVIAVTP
jgi:hypothetical protein